MKKVMAGILVSVMVLSAGIVAAGENKPTNPNHSIDLSHAKSTVDNVVNAGAVKTSTSTVNSSTNTVHVSTTPASSIPGSGGRPSDIKQMKNNPPPPPAKK